MPEKSIISGESFTDHRGSLRFFNSFDMGGIVRFYEIEPVDTKEIRGWQAHQLEKKWFYCTKGSFIINLVEVDDFDKPSTKLKSFKYVLKENSPQVLCVPKGYASALMASESNARLQVFSNFSLEESKNDDYRYPIGQWSANWKID